MHARAQGVVPPTPRTGVRAGVGIGIGVARLALGIAVLALSACRSTPAPPPASPLHEATNAILWLQTSAEYRAATLQAFRSATVHLGLGLADPSWTAATEQTGDFATLPPAIILDMDEAIVRSDRFQAGLVESGDVYRLEDWNDWVRTETAEVIPGALEYVRHARGLGVKVFYVTNRTAEVEAASLATLEKLGFPVEGGAEDLLTQGERPEWGANKSSRRAALCRTHRIVQIVGDNLNDFVSGARSTLEQRHALAERYASYWGSRWIVTPNPAYGGWEGALFDYEYDLPRQEMLDRKRDHLRSWK